jgi:hypothetical protein
VVERNLAKVDVARSNRVSRLNPDSSGLVPNGLSLYPTTPHLSTVGIFGNEAVNIDPHLSD